ncbi:MAG: hypothetical protein HXY39_00425 [Chloroflexi bacterium]|nr:hypothetical protein [Chloroflexota bacterium]
MIRWLADEQLNGLLRRYYGGEAGLWPVIRDSVAAELRRRGVEGARHIRFRRLEDGYEVIIDDAAGYEVE